jgi:hypothetical protein
MYKLIGLAVAALPVVMFLRAVLARHSKKRAEAISDFRRQFDLLIWLILAFIGCAIVYSAAKLVFDFMSR